jgi:hypothetical protein
MEKPAKHFLHPLANGRPVWFSRSKPANIVNPVASRVKGILSQKYSTSDFFSPNVSLLVIDWTMDIYWYCLVKVSGVVDITKSNHSCVNGTSKQQQCQRNQPSQYFSLFYRHEHEHELDHQHQHQHEHRHGRGTHRGWNRDRDMETQTRMRKLTQTKRQT